MKIKICGITELEAALVAVGAGADLLGFNFYPESPRFITTAACAVISAEMARLAPRVLRVGVFVNLPPAEVRETMEFCGLQLAQLSGDESLADLQALEGRAYKAVRGSAASPAAAVEAFFDVRRGEAPVGLLDASVPGKFGGTGKRADWARAARLARQAPILLAGGLNPGNVARAIRQVRPWGVDVASGVETHPGVKDPALVRNFIQNARAVAFAETVSIEVACREDLPEILELQKLAFQGEAALNNDFTIPPLVQTLEQIEQEFAGRTFLKALHAGELVGSVRANLEEGTCYIGRLIVHPQRQNLGIGTQLMDAIETHFAGARRYELFTSEHSLRNLYLYQKLDYRIFRQENLAGRVNLLYLEKMNG
jgi:phosphoribosylanthranilate isomerase